MTFIDQPKIDRVREIEREKNFFLFLGKIDIQGRLIDRYASEKRRSIINLRENFKSLSLNRSVITAVYV